MGNTKSIPFDNTNVNSKPNLYTNALRNRSNSHSPQSELLVSGYISRHLDELHTSNSIAFAIAFSVIRSAILSYYHQSHAQYLCIDGGERIACAHDNSKVKAMIRDTTCFGDIIEIKYDSGVPFFAVVGDNDLFPCLMNSNAVAGDDSKYMEIPFEICRKLDNAREYYSALMNHADMMQYGIREWNFIIQHNDNYVCTQFDGAFQPHYEPIKLRFKDNALESFTIGLAQHHETIFYNQRWKYTAQDIEEYYRLRYHKLIRIEILHSDTDSDGGGVCGNNITFPSGQWEYDRTMKDDVMNECLIGPLDEKDAMLRILHSLYDKEAFVFESCYKEERDTHGYGVYLIISFVPKEREIEENVYASSSDVALHNVSQSAYAYARRSESYDIELESESVTLSAAQLKKMITYCPTRTHLYEWKLFYSTEYDGLSINTMYDNLCDVQESLLIIQDENKNVFGAFVDCEWMKPVAIRKKNGKIQYRGSIDCFVFNYEDESQMQPSVYHASGQSPYFFRNDIGGVTIGAGESCAIYFDYNFMFGRSVACDTYNSPCLASAEQFNIVKLEIWGPNYTF